MPGCRGRLLAAQNAAGDADGGKYKEHDFEVSSLFAVVADKVFYNFCDFFEARGLDDVLANGFHNLQNLSELS